MKSTSGGKVMRHIDGINDIHHERETLLASEEHGLIEMIPTKG